MTSTKKDQLKTLERKRRSHLIKYEVAGFLKNFAVLGLLPFGDGFLIGCFRIAIRSLPFLVGCGLTGNLLIGLISYVATWLALLGICHLVEKSNEKALNAMQDECRADHLIFFGDLCRELGIEVETQRCTISFDDGTVIDNQGHVTHPITPTFQRPVVSFRLYQMENWTENSAYNDLLRDMPWNKTTMKDMFASIDFNRKFGIITNTDAQLDCLRFFTPSVMVEMIKNQPLQKFKEIDVHEDLFNASTEHSFTIPEILDMFAWTSLVKRYEETEQFCRDFQNAAQTIHTDMESIQFMLTA